MIMKSRRSKAVSMVVPIILGIGVSVAVLTAKSTLAAYRKYIHLTPSMIAYLNNIKIDSPSTSLKSENLHLDYLKRHYRASGFEEKMTEREALLIMGIEGDDINHLNKDILKNRYRKLMVMNHPDRNGSQYLTQKINQAKDILDKSYLFRK